MSQYPFTGFAIITAVVSVSCSSETCWNMSVGAEYDVKIKELLTQRQDLDTLFGPACETPPEIQVESRVRFHATRDSEIREDLNGCRQVYADVVLIEGATISDSAASSPAAGDTFQPHLFSGSAEVSINGCRSGWSFIVWGIGDADSNPFGTYDPRDPRVFLNRCFFPEETAECAEFSDYFEEGCCDRFGVEVRKATE